MIGKWDSLTLMHYFIPQSGCSFSPELRSPVNFFMNCVGLALNGRQRIEITDVFSFFIFKSGIMPFLE